MLPAFAVSGPYSCCWSLVTPLRSESGHRRYSRYQLRARELVDAGTPIWAYASAEPGVAVVHCHLDAPVRALIRPG